MQSLSVLYERWISEALEEQLPKEPHATCDNCAMCEASGKTPEAEVFRPDIKCCTFVPRLPNFAVGGILEDSRGELAEGRDNLRRRMALPGTTSPLAVEAKPSESTIYDLVAQEAFGRSAELSCPYFLPDRGGNCSIWQYRNAVCATWFCKHERGQVGQRFWQALRNLLTHVEDGLAVWSAGQMGVPAPALARLLDLRKLPPARQVARELLGYSQELDKRLWGPWWDRREDYFRGCFALVRALSWSSVLAECGATCGLLVEATKIASGDVVVERQVQHPRCGVVSVSRHSETTVFLSTYCNYDPIVVRKEIPATLPCFDGSPVNVARKRILTEYGVDLDLDLIRRLIDFGILVDNEEGA